MPNVAIDFLHNLVADQVVFAVLVLIVLDGAMEDFSVEYMAFQEIDSHAIESPVAIPATFTGTIPTGAVASIAHFDNGLPCVAGGNGVALEEPRLEVIKNILAAVCAGVRHREEPCDERRHLAFYFKKFELHVNSQTDRFAIRCRFQFQSSCIQAQRVTNAFAAQSGSQPFPIA